MKTQVLVLRAIASEFAFSIVKPIALITASALLVIVAVTWLLAVQFSPWWWLLVIPFSVVAGVIGAILLLAWLMIVAIRPDITALQRKEVQRFIDKVSGLNEAVRTPYPLLAARIGLDLLIHRDGRYVRELINDSKSLKGEYKAIQRYFDNPETQERSRVI